MMKATLPSTGSVLYDAPGPRTRRITLFVSVLAAVAIIIVVYLFVYLPLAENGQFTMKKWGPMIDPSNASFDLLWNRLGQGFQNTLIAAVLAIITSLLFGTALAILRLQLQAFGRRRYAGCAAPIAPAMRLLTLVLGGITRFCVEVFRGLPVVITIFFVARGLPEFGLDFDTLWYLVIGLSLYNGVVIGEILRSGMSGLPGGQAEAAASMGLSPFQTTRLILLPQAYRIMAPALISQVVVVLKDTSLAILIGYDDLLNVASQAINILNNPIQLYFVVGVIYLTANYALSKLAEYLQRRLARGRRTAGLPPVAAPPTALVAQLGGGGGPAG